MKLTRDGIKDRAAWEQAGIALPGYDVEAVSEKAKEEPGWVHFGIGNIFRVFIGGIADGLLEEGVLDRGITCVETFDYDVVDKIYKPYDNLGLNVILHGDGTREYKVLGALAEAVKAQVSANAARLAELEETEKELQEKVTKIMMVIPNIIDPSVPIGKDDSCNVEIEKFGEPVVPDLSLIHI